MATRTELMDKVDELIMQLETLKDRLIPAKQVSVEEGLSDIDENLGAIKSGVINLGSGDPGKGFTGLRLGFPALSYGGVNYYMVGVQSDTITWGIRSCDGTLRIMTLNDLFAFNVDYDNNIVNLGSLGLSYPAIHNFTDFEQVPDSDAGTPGAGYGRLYINTAGEIRFVDTAGNSNLVSMATT